MDAVVDQVALPVVDLPIPAVADVAFRCRRGQSLRGEQVLMHPDDEHLLVVGPVEDADPAPPGQGALVTPEEVVVQFFGGRLLEGTDGDRLRVDTAHHVLDGAVLARGVQSLEDQQHAEGVLGGEPVLVLGEKPYAFGEQCGGLRPRHLAGVARMVVPAQLDRAPWRYPQRFDEVGNEAKTLVHSLTMPIPTSPGSRCDDQMALHAGNAWR